MIQDNRPVWVEWDQFLDRVAQEITSDSPRESSEGGAGWLGYADRKRSARRGHLRACPGSLRTTVVDVIVSKEGYQRGWHTINRPGRGCQPITRKPR